MIAAAVQLHQSEDAGRGLREPLYALYSSTIDLCLTLFPWADFPSTKAAVKARTIIDLRDAIPVFVHITTGKVHDVDAIGLHVNRIKRYETGTAQPSLDGLKKLAGPCTSPPIRCCSKSPNEDPLMASCSSSRPSASSMRKRRTSCARSSTA